MSENDKQTIKQFLEMDLHPRRILQFMNEKADRAFFSQSEPDGSSTAAYLSAWGNGRQRFTLQQIENVRKYSMRLRQVDASDAASVDALLDHCKGSVIHRQPYRPALDELEEQPFLIVISHPWQQQLLPAQQLSWAQVAALLFSHGQELERFLKSGDAGVGSKPERHRILVEMMDLKFIRDKGIFLRESAAFKDRNACYPKVIHRFAQHWEGLADRWADFGRLHLPHLKCQTNNLLERFFNTLKYSFMSGRKCSRMADLGQQV
ncbi:hypothetical protein WJX84_008530 [Apatococcus fuscideae]|uniref:Transposase n=1 Tax=Apatococcus fuscideae TaxID=2026836 RepID=A0AAW1TH04_9CHLO